MSSSKLSSNFPNCRHLGCAELGKISGLCRKHYNRESYLNRKKAKAVSEKQPNQPLKKQKTQHSTIMQVCEKDSQGQSVEHCREEQLTRADCNKTVQRKIDHHPVTGLPITTIEIETTRQQTEIKSNRHQQIFTVAQAHEKGIIQTFETVQEETMKYNQKANEAVQNRTEMLVRCGDFLHHWSEEAKTYPCLLEFKTWDFYQLAQHTNRYSCLEDPKHHEEVTLLEDMLVWNWLSCFVQGEQEASRSPLPTLVHIKERKSQMMAKESRLQQSTTTESCMWCVFEFAPAEPLESTNGQAKPIAKELWIPEIVLRMVPAYHQEIEVAFRRGLRRCRSDFEDHQLEIESFFDTDEMKALANTMD